MLSNLESDDRWALAAHCPGAGVPRHALIRLSVATERKADEEEQNLLQSQLGKSGQSQTKGFSELTLEPS